MLQKATKETKIEFRLDTYLFLLLYSINLFVLRCSRLSVLGMPQLRERELRRSSAVVVSRTETPVTAGFLYRGYRFVCLRIVCR